MGNKERAKEEFNFRKTNKTGQRCINCKYIECSCIRCKGQKIFIKCSELSKYLGKLIFVKFHDICDLYKTGNNS